MTAGDPYETLMELALYAAPLLAFGFGVLVLIRLTENAWKAAPGPVLLGVFLGYVIHGENFGGLAFVAVIGIILINFFLLLSVIRDFILNFFDECFQALHHQTQKDKSH